MGAGRIARLDKDPGLTDRICKALEAGAPLDVAAEAEGVERALARRWMRMGKDGAEPYATFRHAVTRARARGKLGSLATALEGDAPGQSNGPAKARQWLLERTDENFQPRVAMRVEAEQTMTLAVIEAVCRSAPDATTPMDVLMMILDALADRDDDGVPVILSHADGTEITEH